MSASGETKKWSAAAQELETFMSALSEEAMCSGWHRGLEHRLWAHLEGERTDDFGQSRLDDETLGRLRHLCEAAGGWIVLRADLNAPILVPLDQWRKLHDEWKRRSGS